MVRAAAGLTVLTKAQKDFVHDYLTDFNATRCYLQRHPKCSPYSARVSSSQLLAKPNVLDYLNKLLAQRAQAAAVTADGLVARAKEIADDPICTPRDRLRAIHLLAQLTGLLKDAVPVQQPPTIIISSTPVVDKDMNV